MSKKIVILHISDISGHKSAGRAIERGILEVNPAADVSSLNFFNYIAPITEKVVNSMYMGVIKRAPIIWQVMYDNPRVVRSVSRARRFVFEMAKPKIEKFIRSKQPDVIVTTQAFPCFLMAMYKEATNAQFKLFAVSTDYILHSFWVSERVDYYVVSSFDAKAMLLQKGVSASSILDSGIPIDPAFAKFKDPSEVRKRLGIMPQERVVLLMGGGQGIAPMKDIVKAFLKKGPDCRIIAVCGTNRMMYKSVKRISKKNSGRIIPMRYVENIDELMTAADVLITKAGGLTVAEALSKGLPMVIISPLPGQEHNNLKFLLKKRACLKADSTNDVVAKVKRLFEDDELMYRLRKNALALGKPNSALTLAHVILGL